FLHSVDQSVRGKRTRKNHSNVDTAAARQPRTQNRGAFDQTQPAATPTLTHDPQSPLLTKYAIRNTPYVSRSHVSRVSFFSPSATPFASSTKRSNLAFATRFSASI